MDSAHKVKRLGIFVFYDASGIVDQYVERLLQGSFAVMNEIVVVVNGGVTESSKKKLERYSKRVYIRENLGFDGGAYKDVFLKLLSREKWEKWDEVILFNDTFYGPVFSWSQVFESMGNETTVDFWGLSRYCGSNYPEHIQSYFLVCRKKLILSASFWNFWNTLEYPKSRLEATEKFEVQFTLYFSREGFIGKSYTDICDKKIDKDYMNDDIVYISCAYEMLSELRIPIIKRTALTISNFIKAKQALEYIKKNTDYSVELIFAHLKRLSGENRFSSFNPWKLEQFYKSNDRIYIYGHGKVGKNIAAYFENRTWKYAGFLVSTKGEDEENVYVYKNIKFNANDGIILALGISAFKEVYPVVKRDLAPKQLFLPYEIF